MSNVFALPTSTPTTSTVVGITGTRSIPEHEQERARDWLSAMLEVTEPSHVHHGDCTGVDALANEVALALGIVTVSHPPDRSIYRAYTASTLTLLPAPYVARNHAIVAACSILLAMPAAPQDHPSQARSGTWATIRYAIALHRRVIVLPL